MSDQYDRYLARHKENVRKGFEWLQTNLPDIVDGSDCNWNIIFNHDSSKYELDEYSAYDTYFYGRNRSYDVVNAFRRAWLLHIHRNPHHWQHWILINDDPAEGEILLEIPYDYIIEMICDWWSFSWQKGDLSEVFTWYDEHSAYIKLAPKTRKTVEDILWAIRERLGYNVLAHHGVKGQKWGVKNGPPYPIDKSFKHDTIVQDAINSGRVSTKINMEKQRKHTKDEHSPGRSYIDGNEEYAQELVDKHSGNGVPITDRHGNWTNKEKFNDSEVIGVHVDADGNETETSSGIITYSKTGTHVYPGKEGK